MVRRVPDDMKVVQSRVRPHHGLNLSNDSFHDQIPFCQLCHNFLFREDLYFECSACGPEAYKRVIMHGKLSNVIPQEGSSMCVECASKLLQAQERKQSRKGFNEMLATLHKEKNQGKKSESEGESDEMQEKNEQDNEEDAKEEVQES
jgi:hypothetical protein